MPSVPAARSVLPPLSLYLHLPWCVAKCPYCDFNSFRVSKALPAADYLRALAREIHQDCAAVAGRELVSVFIGGGTPSLFPPADIATLLGEVESAFTLAADAEVTMEANPGAIEHGAFRAYREAGVNRLSLGAQSFSDRQLQQLGRIHSAAETIAAFDEAVRAGFDSINLDLMYGLPEQTPGAAIDDVKQAVALGPAHLSHYHLTLEPGTAFYRQRPELPDDEQTWAMLSSCQELLQQNGYIRYEISAYARDGQRCRHNLNYWSYGDYLGIGAGAHGKLTDQRGCIRRYANVRQPARYMNAVAAGQHRESATEVNGAEAVFEFMLNALRLPEGFSTSQFEQRTGVVLTEITPLLAEAVESGLLSDADVGRWRPTDRGLRFLDDLQMRFLPSRDVDRPAENAVGSTRVMHS